MAARPMASTASRVPPPMCGVPMKRGQPQQLAIDGRLDREHVERRAAQALFDERPLQRLLVDDAAARGVDEKRVGLHQREGARVDQTARRRVERHVERHDVRPFEQRVERHRRDARLSR